ncbi:MAG: DNA methyltransferase [Kiritimatiellia bacterium]
MQKRSPPSADPACGCGNFLVITYRDLPPELDILKELHRDNQKLVQGEMTLEDVNHSSHRRRPDVRHRDRGIPPPASPRSPWLADHQMNQELSLTFGQFVLQASPPQESPHCLHECLAHGLEDHLAARGVQLCPWQSAVCGKGWR